MDRTRKITCRPVLLFLAVVLAIPSCIDDKIMDCRVDVSFNYSYNMLSSNAFEQQADQVALYVFDEDGLLVAKHVSEENRLSDGFQMQTDDLKAGNYRFVAWAQSTDIKEDKAYFNIPRLTVGTSFLDDLSYYLKRESGIQQQELNNLLVGVTEVNINNVEGIHPVTIDLKKVTRRLRVVLLPYLGGTALDVEDYVFSIIDDAGNGHINYDYGILPDEAITYRPYYAANVLPDASETLPPEEIDRAAVVELNTSRLIESHNPRLVISGKKNGKEIIRLNLPWFLSLTEMEGHKQAWSLQEYLDRQDEYVITLFLDAEENLWMQNTIIINGWVINDLELGM